MNIATTYPKALTKRFTKRTADASGAPPPLVLEPLRSARPRLDIVVPVYNEAHVLVASVERLAAHLATLPYDWRIVIADNASTDATWTAAQALAATNRRVQALHLDGKGRGRALKAAWLASNADLLAYTDVDLSTDLSALEPMLVPLAAGEAPVATASRLSSGACVTRSRRREIISRGYNWLIKRSLRTRFSDAQCGFKAIRREAAQLILPQVKDNNWFFDTELLAKAEHRGWQIHEVAADWTEDPDSRVHITRTAAEDLRGLWRVRRELALAPSWELPAFAGLIAAAAIAYIWNLSSSGYANSFYAAAVQAATVSWKAWFFGSFDASNFITVDKPPFALWVMGLSGRIFGFNSWSMLLPNALAGVASVAILARTVRRWHGPAAGLLAGAALVATPVAALMFRFNNPDAILVLLMVLAAWCTTRALESGQTKWLVWVGVLLGTAFITKMLQGLVLVPIIAAVYLLAGPPKLAKRLWQLAVAGVSLAVAALWWPVAVMLVPASQRPYIGGSTNNSIWDLIIGYNGLGRINGTAVGSPGTLGGRAVEAASNAASTVGGAMGAMGGGPGGGGMGASSAFGGTAGLGRMFNAAFGTEISWLLPLALIAIVAGLYLRRGKPRTDLVRAGILLWGGWLLVHMAIFSFMKGTIHPYYSVALAPAIAALVGIGIATFTKFYGNHKLSWLWPLTLAVSSVWVWMLLGTNASFVPWLRWLVVSVGLVTAGLWWGLTAEATRRTRLTIAGLGVAALLAGPLAWTVATASTAHAGSIPTSGPSGNFTGGPGGGMASPGGFTAGSAMGNGGQTGGTGGGLGTSAADTALVNYLTAHRGTARWLAATVSTLAAAPVQLASNQPVMAIGGFNGSDNAPTLEQFKAYVQSGQLRYFYTSSSSDGMGPGGMGASSQTEILNWVKANATVVSYGGTGTLYDLSAAVD